MTRPPKLFQQLTSKLDNMRLGFYILLFLFSCFLSAQNEMLLEEGNTFYNNGKYIEAIEKYEEILNSDQHS